jgi:hypothetical protein
MVRNQIARYWRDGTHSENSMAHRKFCGVPAWNLARSIFFRFFSGAGFSRSLNEYAGLFHNGHGWEPAHTEDW